MAETAAKDAGANTGGERRSRRGTWSLVAVGFSVLLLLLVTVAIGVQSYIVSRGFRSGQEASSLQRQMLGLRNLQLTLSQVERAASKAQASGKPEDFAAYREELGRLVVIAGQTSLSMPGVSAAMQLQAESHTGSLTEMTPATGQFGEALDRQFNGLAAQLTNAAEEASKWQKRSFHLIFLTNNLAMLLLITGGGLLLLYAGWHLDARQKLVEARQAVLKAERDRASFVAAAGHDLRQPLQAISLFLTTLSHRTEDAETKSLLIKIGQAATSMRRMINGLLDVAKLDAGLVSADQMDQPLGDMFASLREEFERQAEAKGLVLVIEPSDAVVHTDPLLLESMLRNLLANAINYTHQGHVSLSARPNGRRIVITVRDTGPGIAADELDLIFRDFYRVGGSGGGGLGLGLGIVQRMAKLIYAQVAVDSTVGLGTRFTVAVSSGVPMQPAAPMLAPPAPPPAPPPLPLPRPATEPAPLPAPAQIRRRSPKRQTVSAGSCSLTITTRCAARWPPNSLPGA